MQTAHWNFVFHFVVKKRIHIFGLSLLNYALNSWLSLHVLDLSEQFIHRCHGGYSRFGSPSLYWHWNLKVCLHCHWSLHFWCQIHSRILTHKVWFSFDYFCCFGYIHLNILVTFCFFCFSCVWWVFDESNSARAGQS